MDRQMKAPQLKQGFIQIATGKPDNDILLALIKENLTASELKIILLVIRKTWGYKKKEDWISLTQFQKYTGKSRPQVCNSIRSLVKRNILVKRTLLGKGSLYSFNKQFKTWKTTSKVEYTGKVDKTTSKVHNTQLVKCTLHTKETIQKKLIQKKYTSVKNITQTDLEEIAKKYNVPASFVISKLDDMENWMAAKGKRYKNYKRALMNWVKRDAMKIISSAKRNESKYVGATKV